MSDAPEPNLPDPSVSGPSLPEQSVSDPSLPEQSLPEQMRVRLAKRERLLAAGVPPYPVTVERTHSLSDIVAAFDPESLGADHRTGQDVAVTGRVIFLRNTGKLCFVRLRAGDGAELQVMIALAGVGAESLAQFKSLVDIGDHLGVRGEVVTSRRGELSIAAVSWQLAAKALRPLPNEHRPLSEEARVRLRYVDMVVNPQTRAMVHTRAAVLRSLRATLDGQGYVEVETPVLQLTNGGAAARPFRTRVNAFEQDMLLRIALEIDLKKALVGGVERVYEIGRTFRNEGIDSTHAPEFSMLEAYQAYGDYNSMATLVQDLVTAAARVTGGTEVSLRDGSTTDLADPWRHATFFELVSESVSAAVTPATTMEEARRLARKHSVEIHHGWGAADILLELYEKLVEHTLLQPTFVRDFPAEVKPLAKGHRTQPGLGESFDLVVNGVELAMANTEMNDPVDQRERLVQQGLAAAEGNPEAMDLDENFLRALEYGMPPAGGLGMGVDRLIMLITGAGIRETILFPLLRPE